LPIIKSLNSSTVKKEAKFKKTEIKKASITTKSSEKLSIRLQEKRPSVNKPKPFKLPKRMPLYCPPRELYRYVELVDAWTQTSFSSDEYFFLHFNNKSSKTPAEQNDNNSPPKTSISPVKIKIQPETSKNPTSLLTNPMLTPAELLNNSHKVGSFKDSPTKAFIKIPLNKDNDMTKFGIKGMNMIHQSPNNNWIIAPKTTNNHEASVFIQNALNTDSPRHAFHKKSMSAQPNFARFQTSTVFFANIIL